MDEGAKNKGNKSADEKEGKNGTRGGKWGKIKEKREEVRNAQKRKSVEEKWMKRVDGRRG